MEPPANSSDRWDFWIDVGGTFTDCLARRPDGRLVRYKLLSSGASSGTISRSEGRFLWDQNAATGPDQFWQGARLTIENDDGSLLFDTTVHSTDTSQGRLTLDDPLPEDVQDGMSYRLQTELEAPLLAIRWLLGLAADQPVPDCNVRLGTTRGTNALLTRSGADIGLLTTRGLGDLLRIGNQDRPQLFDLAARRPAPLFKAVAEIDERVSSDGEVIRPLDLQQARQQLEQLRQQGIDSLAISLLNAYRLDIHEQQLGELAAELGFQHVSLSSQLAPLIKLVSRSQTTLLNAYLDPVLVDYIARLQAGLSTDSSLRLLTSAGGLVSPAAFSGKESILSGPAGGLVGAVAVARQAGFDRLIGFDMGGTSTDVSRFDGQFQYDYETERAGVRIVTPMMAIQTVAAGGGSICRFDGVKLVVGPESAGADPGPACYGRGGPLTVTDVNLLLGKLRAESFPFQLDPAASRDRMSELLSQLDQARGQSHSSTEVAAGLLRIADASMVEAIRSISVARGYDPRDHLLVAFGGAAGQHACEVARQLGIRTILNHPDAGILSAYGIGVAAISRHQQLGIYQPLSQLSSDSLEQMLEQLSQAALAELESEGVPRQRASVASWAEVRYQGMEARLALPGPLDDPGAEWLASLPDAFAAQHQQYYGYLHDDRPLELVALRVEATGQSTELELVADKPNSVEAVTTELPSAESVEARFAGQLHATRLLQRSSLQAGQQVPGPAILLEPYSTTVVDPGWTATLLPAGELLLEDERQQSRLPTDDDLTDSVDAASLEVFNNRFAGIAEQMGITLQNTSSSVNVKERLDFSCALFTATGDLVVNAPHIPVHLGAMGETVRSILADYPDMRPGDVFVSNDPYRGGSHLPDITVVTPVFDQQPDQSPVLMLFTASRAHHAEIGGISPGSMPPFSQNLGEEGVLIRNRMMLQQGQWRGDELRELLLSGPYPTRNVEDNMADLRAQVAANHQGQHDICELIDSHGRQQVLFYMQQIQLAAETKMRAALDQLDDGEYPFEDFLDDGARIAVNITIRGDEAEVDFSGTAGQLAGNLNANRAIVQAAVMYVMRCLIDEDIPLNQGVLTPLTLKIPAGLLAPEGNDDPASCPAVAGGNVETSQRVVDVLLGALGLAAASQGTMNNLLFGNDQFGYYETICGGAGATPTAAGQSAVHTHMTNTRITDPEVLEQRYPVRLIEFSLRRGSGGAGRHAGGDGAVRCIEFLEPLQVSILSQRRGDYPPFGLAGGEAGQVGENQLRRADGTTEELAGRARIDVVAGDRLTIRTPGGGGWKPARADL